MAEAQPLLARENSRTRQPPGRQQSHHSIPDDEAFENVHGKIEVEIRNGFIKKVYSLLTIEIFATAAICAVFMFHKPLREASIVFVKEHHLMWQIVMFASLMASICALMMKKNEYPANYQLLAVFVLVMSCNIGVVCAFFYAAGKGMAIAQAVAVTGGIFLVLSAYAHWTKVEFDFSTGFMISLLWALILFGFIAYISGSTLMVFVYHVLGVLLFCGFILYDTSMLIHKYGCDDYIIASIELYLDIINLFLHILALLGDR
jgi:FtsH-binding integral membrane protein